MSQQSVTTADRARVSAADWVMLGVAMTWGVNAPVMKAALHDFSPLAFNGLRFILCGVAMAAVLWKTGDWRIQKKDWPMIIVVAMLGNMVYQWLYVKGLNLTTATNAALISASMPILLVLVTAAMGQEQIRPAYWLGAPVSFAGLVLVSLASGQKLSLGGAHLTGDLILLAAQLAWACYTAFSHQLYTHYAPLKLTAYGIILGGAGLVLVSIPEMVGQDYGAVSTSSWLGLFYSCSMSITLAYIAWNWAVNRAGAARAGIYVNLVPLFAALVSWGFLGEEFGLPKLGGALLVLLGVWLARR